MHDVHTLKPAGDLKTLLLNNAGRPTKVIKWQRGFALVYENKAICLETYEGHAIRDGKAREHEVPAVIMLKRHISKPLLVASLNKINILARDDFTCQFCSKRGSSQVKLTIDHVYPRALGGKTKWTNVVTACIQCNRKKGDLTCEEAGMFPVKPPISPAFSDRYCGVNPNNVPNEWVQYVNL